MSLQNGYIHESIDVGGHATIEDHIMNFPIKLKELSSEELLNRPLYF